MNDLRKTNLLLSVLVVLAVGFLLLTLRGILLPLFVAMFLSYVAMPAVRLGKRFRVPVALTLVAVLLLFGLGMGLLGKVIFTSGARFVDDWPEYEAQLRPWILDGLRLARVPEEYYPEEGETLWQALSESDLVRVFARAGATSFLGWAGNLALILVFLIFIILDRGRESLDQRIIAAFSTEGGQEVRPVVERIHGQIESYILTKTGISLVTGILVGTVLAIFGTPFALLFGVLAFLLNFIPNIGSIIATLPPILVTLVDGSPLRALAVALVLGTIQLVIGNFAEPMIMGKKLQLNPITVLLSLALWGWLWGIWGMVLAVPLAATLRIVLDQTPSLRAVGTLMNEA